MDAKPMAPAEIATRLRAVTEDDAYAQPWTFGQHCITAADCIDAQAAEITALRAERDALAARLAVPGEEEMDKAQRVASVYRFEDADGEINLGTVIGALRARVAGLEGALIYLRTSAAVLQQHAEDCAVQCHGCDFDREGMPGWLADTRASIDRAAALTPSAQEARK